MVNKMKDVTKRSEDSHKILEKKFDNLRIFVSKPRVLYGLAKAHKIVRWPFI